VAVSSKGRIVVFHRGIRAQVFEFDRTGTEAASLGAADAAHCHPTGSTEAGAAIGAARCGTLPPIKPALLRARIGEE
jgi:hypothetical protein